MAARQRRNRQAPLTSYFTIQDDMRNAGTNWVDREVCVDGNLVTSRKPDDIPAFNREMTKLFAARDKRHASNLTGPSSNSKLPLGKQRYREEMKLTVATLAVGLLAAVPLASCSQQAAAQDSQQSPARAEMQKARDDAKTAAFNDLSADHRARVQAIIDQINNGSSSDLRGAVSQIDAMLTPAESKAVLGERDKMIAAIRANAPAGAFNGNGSRGFGNGQARNDAGRFLVQVSVSRDRMRELRQQQQQSQPQQ